MGKATGPEEMDMSKQQVMELAAKLVERSGYLEDGWKTGMHLGLERKLVTNVWEKGEKSRTYISVYCYTGAGNYKGKYALGHIDNVTGEYIPGEINIVEKAEELGLTATPEEAEEAEETAETEETTTETAEAPKAEEVKETETHTMRGTDKQLYWAEHIQQVTLETMEYMIAYANTKGREQAPEKAEALIGKLTRMKDALEKASYAGDVIECFRGVEEAQDTNGRVAAIMSAIKIMAPMTQGQRKLLDR